MRRRPSASPNPALPHLPLPFRASCLASPQIDSFRERPANIHKHRRLWKYLDRKLSPV